jgi:succinate-semialdehyde dehydrogenase/glutarate-semialdehyde dehydrogenase
MSDYAVTNPATGETLKTYPTIGDQELHTAISRRSCSNPAALTRSSC